MALWDGLSTAGRAVAVGGSVAVVTVAGYFGLVKAKVEPVPQEVVAVAEPAVKVEPVAEVAPVVAVVLPSFDVVRVAPDGAATVAGSAAAGAKVSLQVDGAEVAFVTANGQGKFAALFTLSPSPVPRLLSVVATLPDGVAQVGSQTVALAPIAEPEAVVVEAPAALLVSPEGVKVLQPAEAVPAEVAANVSVETITYAADGAVVLGGHGQANAALRVYLDQAAVADVMAQADGAWGVTLADVTPGIYTLRVDQLDAGGKVSSRFETPFKRETLQALAAVAAPEAVVAEPEAAPAVVEPVIAPEAKPAEVVVAEPEKIVEQVAEAAKPVEPVVEATVAAVAKVEAAPAPVSITVQPGFTLWSIAKQNFGDGVMYVQVFAANKDKIKNPDLIYPGQVFTIPTQP